jgi:hypothetical protein
VNRRLIYFEENDVFEELRNLYSSSEIIRIIRFSGNEIGGACSSHVSDETVHCSGLEEVCTNVGRQVAVATKFLYGGA